MLCHDQSWINHDSQYIVIDHDKCFDKFLRFYHEKIINDHEKSPTITKCFGELCWSHFHYFCLQRLRDLWWLLVVFVIFHVIFCEREICIVIILSRFFLTDSLTNSKLPKFEKKLGQWIFFLISWPTDSTKMARHKSAMLKTCKDQLTMA